MVDEIKGVFYESKTMEVGTMATKRVHDAMHDLHYYCKSNSSGQVDLYYLKPDGSPTAIVMETIEREEFDTRFKDCSNHKCELKPLSKEEKLADEATTKVNIGQQHLERKEFNAAAYEFGQASKIDKTNLHAHLGKGKAHLGLGEVDKAKESFQKMSEIDTLYDKENKHIFNEYGIELRRGQLYDLAIENYKKALSIDSEDEALHFNMARAYQESGNNKEAVKYLEKALALKPDFTEAKSLYAALTKKALG